jgi:uncharacterized protein (DUF952 family)
MIYHMLPLVEWQAHPSEGAYAPSSLATEGFIHCTKELDRLLWVANRFYAKEPGAFVILLIDEEALQARLHWEPADGHTFPHIYGALNLDAVKGVVDFPRTATGQFRLPEQPLI